MDYPHALRAYVRFRLRVARARPLLTPFVHRLYAEVVCADAYNPAFSPIEARRYRLRHDPTPLLVTDHGRGGQMRQRRVREVARSALQSPRSARLLYRLAQFCAVDAVYELGTSLGVTTQYLVAARPAGQIVTFEGCPATAALAQRALPPSVRVEVGPLAETLPAALARYPAPDLVVLDAHHRYAPTLTFFETFLPYASPGTVLVFDDLYWSPEMTRAWRDVCAHPSVRLSVDLFRLGLVFFRDQPKQHVELIY